MHNSCSFSLAIQIIFVSLHRKIENKHLELMNNWDKAQKGEPLDKIEPLK